MSAVVLRLREGVISVAQLRDWSACACDRRVADLARHLGRPADDDDAARKLTDRVLSWVAQGELGKAAHLLQSTCLANPTDATADILRPLLCLNPQQQPPS